MQDYELVIASDHAGVELKSKIIDFLMQQKITVKDLGTNGDEKVDYPDYAKKTIEEMLENTAPSGILICGTGIGMSIAANRNSSIRAALCLNEFMAERARQHNDANILVLGSALINDDDALKIVDKFLNTKFEGGRHNRRLNKLG